MVDLAVPLAPWISTPPIPGSMATSCRASRIRGCPTMAEKGKSFVTLRGGGFLDGLAVALLEPGLQLTAFLAAVLLRLVEHAPLREGLDRVVALPIDDRDEFAGAQVQGVVELSSFATFGGGA